MDNTTEGYISTDFRHRAGPPPEGGRCACGHHQLAHGPSGRCLAAGTTGSRNDGKRVVRRCDCTSFAEADHGPAR